MITSDSAGLQELARDWSAAYSRNAGQVNDGYFKQPYNVRALEDFAKLASTPDSTADVPTDRFWYRQPHKKRPLAQDKVWKSLLGDDGRFNVVEPGLQRICSPGSDNKWELTSIALDIKATLEIDPNAERIPEHTLLQPSPGSTRSGDSASIVSGATNSQSSTEQTFSHSTSQDTHRTQTSNRRRWNLLSYFRGTE